MDEISRLISIVKHIWVWIELGCFSVGEHSGPHGWPCWMYDLSVGDVSTE